MNYQTLQSMAHRMKGQAKDVFDKQSRLADFDDFLGQLGLERKSSARNHYAMYAAGFFGLGIAVGGALGMLFAPKRGQQLREDAVDMAKEKLPFLSRPSLPGQEQIIERSN